MNGPDPTAILARVPGWAGKARLVGDLDGGITNRNFLVEVDGARFVVRVPGANTHLLEIDRGVEREANTRAAGLGIAPEVVAFVEPEGALVTRFVDAEPLRRDAMTEPATLARIAALIRSFHESGPLAREFDAFSVPSRHLAAAAGHDVAVPDAYERVPSLAQRIARAFSASAEPRCACHNDLLDANFLRGHDRLWLLDWEYSGMNDRYFDLANLAVNNGFAPEDELALVETYFGRVTERRVARLRLMKILSDAREATWALVQVGVSTIDFDYEGYAQQHLDRLLINAGAPDFHDLLDAAARPESGPTA
jgi:thiamine kinase-like enzyme